MLTRLASYAYDDIWQLLSCRFGQTDAPRDTNRHMITEKFHYSVRLISLDHTALCTNVLKVSQGDYVAIFWSVNVPDQSIIQLIT